MSVGLVLSALLALLALAALGAAALVRRRRRRRAAVPEVGDDADGRITQVAAPDGPPLAGVVALPSAPPRGPPLPVILIHGLFGFDRIGIPGLARPRVEYFRGIAAHLEGLGCHAHAVRLPAARAVPDRAARLAAAIAQLPHPRVDLIAHSLGGLDARYALAHLGLASRVRALVTIGTPHRGTPIADLAIAGSLGRARRHLYALGLPTQAVDWLSTAALERFNREVPDAPGVRYASVVGGIWRDASALPLALVPLHAYLRRTAGANDGLVPVASQYWGETLAEIEADHFAQIGWRSGRATFDALGLYAFIVARLGDVAGAPASVGAPASAPGA
jgi:triacylglycerol lipase